MERTHSQNNNAPPKEAKQKKLRKGTQSCWECKRRKMRCAFASPSDAICVACERRGTLCASQEVAEKEPPVGGDQPIGEKLSRIGELLEQCTRMIARGGGAVDNSRCLSPKNLVRQYDGSAFVSSYTSLVGMVLFFLRDTINAQHRIFLEAVSV
jgi:hypothetical protein